VGWRPEGPWGRILLTVPFILLLARLGWLQRAGLMDRGDAHAWLIALGPFLYVIVVLTLSSK
jgi:hypothetical protein